MTTNLEEFKQDYNWRSAFSEAINHCYQYDFDDDKPHPIDPVEEVFASIYGEHDGDHWTAIVFMGSPHLSYALIDAGCDYTGWDCQAWGSAEFFQTLDAACSKVALTNEQRERLEPQLRALAATGRVTLDW